LVCASPVTNLSISETCSIADVISHFTRNAAYL